MSEPPKFAKDYADQFKTSRGVVDFYRFLGVSRKASHDEIAHAIMTKTSVVESSGAENYLKITMLGIAQKHLATPAARAAYDRKLTPAWRRMFNRADTRAKRVAILAFPFFAIIALYRWVQDTDGYWEPSLSFFVFAAASVMCLFIAFTSLGDWMNASK